MFAADKHRNQRRKGRTKRPYIDHCLEVAEAISRIGGVDDPNVLAAAILHDTVEDTKTTHEDLVEEFGVTIAGLVAEVTDDKGLEKKERKRLQIRNAPHKSAGAKLIKLADKISNVREIGHDPPAKWDVKRRREYFSWAKRVVDALGRANPALERAFAETLSESRALLRNEPAKV